jgi:hypothetical protein
MTGLTVAVHNHRGGLEIDLVVSGALDPTDAPELADRLVKIVQVRQPIALTLDLRALRGTDSVHAVSTSVDGAVRSFGGDVVVLHHSTRSAS